MSIPTTRLGRTGLTVSRLALGTMTFGLQTDEAVSHRILDKAAEGGINFLDTADMYGPYTNEELLGRGLAGRRHQAFVASKFGIVRDAGDPHKRGVSGHPDYLRQSIEGSLQRLNTDYLDLYYQHRIDPDVPIEDTVGALAELMVQGKIRHIGLSEVAPTTLRRAHAVHPIAAVQSEYSLWSRDPEENGVLATCRKLGIAFVPYSPLGRGFLTGALQSPDDFEADDFRRHNPRFQGENFARNLQLVAKVQSMAANKGVSAAQLALAWVLAKGDDIVPIPGTKRRRYLDENLAALEIELSVSEVAALDDIFPAQAIAGERYAPGSMQTLYR